MPPRGTSMTCRRPSLGLAELRKLTVDQFKEIGKNLEPNTSCTNSQFPNAPGLDETYPPHPCVKEPDACKWSPSSGARWYYFLSDVPKIPRLAQSLAEAFGMLYEEALCETAYCLVATQDLVRGVDTNGQPDKFSSEEHQRIFEFVTNWYCAPWRALYEECATSAYVETCFGGAQSGPMSSDTDGNATIVTRTAVSARPATVAAVELTYNSSNSGSVSEFGYGWTLNYGSRVVDLGTGSIKLTTGQGVEWTYTGSPSIGSLYTAPAAAKVSVRRLASGWDVFDSIYTSSYNASGLLTSVVGPEGTYSLTYSGSLLTKITDPQGGITTFTYASGKISAIQDSAGRTTDYTVDANGNLTKVQTPELCITSFIYDASHRLTASATPANVQTSYAYDASNRLTRIVWPAEVVGGVRPVTTMTYGTNLLEVQDPRGGRTTYTLDANGQPTSIVAANNGRTTMTWQNGWATTVRNPANELYSFTYESCATDASLKRLLAVVQPAGACVTYQYNSSDQLQGFKYVDGCCATLSWSGQMITSYQNALSQCSTYAYTADQQLSVVQNAAGCCTTLSYDSNRQLQEVQSALGQRTTYSYNAAGFAKTILNPLGQCCTIQRDDVNRITQLDVASGRCVTYTYDCSRSRF